MEFCAKALFVTSKGSGVWNFSDVIIKSKQDILDVFTPNQDSVKQVDFSSYGRLYYSSSDFSTAGVMARCSDVHEQTQVLPSPLLFVLCDAEKPIDYTQEFKDSIRERVDFY